MGPARFVEVDGVCTRYFDTGQGPPVVLVHGGDFRSLSSADDWSMNADVLSRDFRVISPDKLGQGWTDVPKSDHGFTMSAATRHLQRFVDTLGLDEMTLVGHSRGALPVAWIALEQPTRVRSLVVFNSNTLAPEHPATPKGFYFEAYANRPEVPDAEFVRREPVNNSYDSAHVDDAFVARRLEIARLPKTYTAVLDMARLYKSQFVPDFSRLRAEVLARIDAGGLRCPVSLIWSRNDVSAPLVIGEELAARIAATTPHMEFHVLNHAGHYTYREQPHASNGIMRDLVHRSWGGTV